MITKEYTKESIDNELISLLDYLDIPDIRKPLHEHNLRWMLRNLGIKNSNNPKFDRAMYCAKYLLQMVEPEHGHISATDKNFSFKKHICKCGYSTKSKEDFNVHIGVDKKAQIYVKA